MRNRQVVYRRVLQDLIAIFARSREVLRGVKH
jgi:hypothetical protein